MAAPPRSSRFTRRSLLAAGAGAAAAHALRTPAASFAASALGSRPFRLAQQPLGELRPGRPRTVRLEGPADLVGASWTAGHGLQLRVLRSDGSWSPWVSADDHGHGPEGARDPRTVGDPVWTGGATRALQLRSRARLHDVVLHLVDVSAGSGAHSASLPLAAPVLDAGPGQPPIVARSAWAPRGVARPRVAPEYGSVRLAFVHHTENPNGYAASEVPAMLRAIYVFHRYVRGWDDIGYNFVIDLYGRIFEARAGGIDEAVVGAQAGGYNLVSTGVAILGTFSSVPISAPAHAALESLLAWKLALHGVPAEGRVTVRVNPAGAVYSRFPANARVSLPRIAGHRDGDSTDCPGDVLYAELPAIRGRVRRLAPAPAQLTLTLAAGTLGGALTLPGGAPVAGAAIALQSRTVAARGEAVTETTLAEVLADGEGRFAFAGQFAPVAKGHGLWLRALYAGRPGGPGAAVSEALHVAAVTPAPPPAPVPTV